MTAGHSAAGEAAAHLARAEEAEYVARTSRQMYQNYSAAAMTEARLGRLLEPLAERGYHVLADRLWPGSRSANVDFVLVGPSGVFIIDAKSWKDVSLIGERVYQGQDDVTELFENLCSLSEVTESALAEVGIAPGEVHIVAVFMGRRNLKGRVGAVELIGENEAPGFFLGRGDRLSLDRVAIARAALERLYRPYSVKDIATEPTLVEPVIATSDANALITLAEVEEALYANIMVRLIEEWMAFLHPDQARLARRSFNGPSRIRGAAGTGKTVVGLHRACHIARTRPGTVLVTTFVRTLPDVLSSLMERMAPQVVDRVEFSGIHAFALKLLRERGVPVFLDQTKADLQFDRAWRSVGKDGELGRIDPRPDYWPGLLGRARL
jgi:hypothetical protein